MARVVSTGFSCPHALIRSRVLRQAAGAALSIAAFATGAHAQYVWTGNTSGTFSDTTRWLNGLAPISGASTTLTFQPSPALQTAAITATQNITTPFQVNGMTFGNMSVANGLTIAGTSGNSFQVVGPSATYSLTGAGAHTFSATGATTQLATDLLINGSGMGTLTFTGAISETGGARSITISTTPATHVNGMVVLGVSSSFTGGVTLDGGNLGSGGFVGPQLGTGAFTVTNRGGVLQLVNALTLASTGTNAPPSVNVNGQLRIITASVGLTIGNQTALQGNGPIIVNAGSGTNNLVISNAASGYSGSVTVDRFDLPQMTGAGGGVQITGGTGSMLGVSTFNVRNGGSLWANNATANVAGLNDRIANTATINLSSGALQVSGTSTTSTPQSSVTEVVGTVNAAGYSTFQATANAGVNQSTVINVNSSLARSERGTMLFRGANLGSGTLSVSGVNGDGSQNFQGSNVTGYVVVPGAMASNLVGGGGAAGSTGISILPYAIADANTSNTGTGTSFVTLDTISGSSSRNVRPLATAEYATSIGVPSDNVRLTAATANAGVSTVNSLVLASSGLSDGGVSGGGTLNVTSGAILSATTNTIGSIANNVAFGTAEGHIFTPGLGLAISGNLTGSNGLTKSGGSGANTLTLTGDNTGLTGALTFNGGSISVPAASSLPGTGTITFNGAGVATTGAATALIYTGNSALTLGRDINASSGYAIFRSTDNTGGGNIILGGQITGNGGVALQSNGTGVITIARTDNTYTGPTSISSSQGTIRIAGDGAFGNGGGLQIAGSITLDGDWITSRHINNGGMTINTNGFNASFNGPMTNFTAGSLTAFNNNAALTKNGAGTLSITSDANQLGGAITVNAGSLIVTGTIAGSTTNAVTAAAGMLGGTGTIWRNINVGAATPSVTAGVLSPGVNGPGVLTQNGNLAFVASTGSSFDVDLAGSNAGAGYDRMVTNGTIALNGALLNLTLGYAPLLTDSFFILANDGTDAITGQFDGLAQDAVVTLGTWGGNVYTAQISYTGDLTSGAATGGNDVVIYNVVPAPGAIGMLALGGLVAARRRRA